MRASSSYLAHVCLRRCVCARHCVRRAGIVMQLSTSRCARVPLTHKRPRRPGLDQNRRKLPQRTLPTLYHKISQIPLHPTSTHSFPIAFSSPFDDPLMSISCRLRIRTGFLLLHGSTVVEAGPAFPGPMAHQGVMRLGGAIPSFLGSAADSNALPWGRPFPRTQPSPAESPLPKLAHPASGVYGAGGRIASPTPGPHGPSLPSPHRPSNPFPSGPSLPPPHRPFNPFPGGPSPSPAAPPLQPTGPRSVWCVRGPG
jgi:hypothetical protein